MPLPSAPIETGANVPAVYQWLRDKSGGNRRFPLDWRFQLPPSGVVVEPPIDTTPLQARYEYFSTYHGWTLVNGYRAFDPPGYAALAAALQSFPSPGALDLLADLRATYVVVHLDQFSPDDRARLDAALGGAGDRVRPVQRFGSDLVYEVAGTAKVAPLSLSLASSCLARPGQELPAALVAESSGRSLVAVPSAPRAASATAVWHGADGHSVEQLLNFPLIGTVLEVARRFPIALTAPREPGDYRLGLLLGPEVAGLASGPAERVVHVVADTSSAAAFTPLQVTSFETIAPAVRSDGPVIVKIRWKATSTGVQRGVVFVNVYDDSYRYWSLRGRAVVGEVTDGAVLCAGDEWLDVREVTLAKGTPPGYYHVEVGVVDPMTSQRLPLLDPTGRLGETVAAAPLRVASAVPDIIGANAGVLVGAVFGGGLELESWWATPTRPAPGGTVRLGLLWRATSTPAASYNVFAHLYDVSGRLVAQHDGPPGGGAWPTSCWQSGDQIEDAVDLTLPPGLTAGDYTLAVGLYDPTTLRRLPHTAGPALGDDRARAGVIVVSPSR